MNYGSSADISDVRRLYVSLSFYMLMMSLADSLESCVMVNELSCLGVRVPILVINGRAYISYCVMVQSLSRWTLKEFALVG